MGSVSRGVAWAVAVAAALGAAAMSACSTLSEDCAEARCWEAGAAGGGAQGGAGIGGGGPGGSAGAGGTTAVCGNDIQEEGEECDDGNTADADGCEGDCTLPRCGNGIVDPAEICFGGPIVSLPAETSYAADMILGDCDGDGDLDALVVGTSAGPGSNAEIVALRNDGLGAFGNPAWSATASPSPVAIASGQLEPGAARDVVLAFGPSMNASLRTFAGNGDCTFDPALVVPLGAAPSDVVALAIDGDPLDEFAALVNLLGAPQLVYYQTQQGLPAESVPAGITTPTGMTVANLDGGALDLVYADVAAGKVVVRSGTGGSFGSVQKYPSDADTTGPGPIAVAAADLDGDGDTDVVTANVGTGTANDGDSLTSLLNDGTGALLLGVTMTITGSGPVEAVNPVSLWLGDVNGDGYPDAITANQALGGGQSSLSLLINDGAGTFALASDFPIAVAGFPDAVQLVDVNGDGARDVVCLLGQTNGDVELAVLLANP